MRDPAGEAGTTPPDTGANTAIAARPVVSGERDREGEIAR